MGSISEMKPPLGPRRSRELARGLGWFSLGLGLAEVLAPEALARGLGMRGSETLVRACGGRNIATGIGLLATRNPKPWLLGRSAGDALDLGGLAAGLHAGNPKRATLGAAMAAVAGVAALDLLCAASFVAEDRERASRPRRDYSDRSGLPRGLDASRGAAGDFEAPEDFRIPEPLRPYAATPRAGTERS